MTALLPLLPAFGKAALAMTKGSAVKMATRSLVSGAAFQAGVELVYQIGEWARSIGADWDSEEPGPTPPSGPGCQAVDGEGNGVIELLNGLNFQPAWSSPIRRIIRTYPGKLSPGSPAGSTSYAELELPSGEIVIGSSGAWPHSDVTWYIDPIPPSVCIGTGPTGDLPPQQLPPITEGDCTFNVTFMGFMGNPEGAGNVEPVFIVKPAQQLRASGGVITGECNFAPTVIVGGGGDGGGEPPRTIPNPPGDEGGPDWWKAVAQGIAQGVTSAIVSKIMNELFSIQEIASFTLTAPCDKDDEGNPFTYQIDFPAESYSQRMISWQIAQADLLQQHLNWKTPICSHETPSTEGVFRTISFRSDQTSPYGKSRLRKRFRYRCLSGNDDNTLVDHWKDFSFEGGPHRVRWTGPTWRSPEVWAASPAEGKRVIQHAADEAGVGPLEAGGWSTRLSGSGRQGVPGTMRVDTTGDYYWITARDGSDARPRVAKVPE